MSTTWWNWCRSRPRRRSRRPVDDQRVADAAAVDVLLVPLERRVAGLRPARSDSGCAPVPPIGRSTARFSSSVLGAVEVAYALTGPTAPPSGLAPLSEMHDDQRVVELAERSRTPTSRPICASVCSRKPAYTSCSRAQRRARSSRQLVPGPHAGVARASSVPGGTIPSAFCRRERALALASQPSSNRPAYFSTYRAAPGAASGSAEGEVEEERPLGRADAGRGSSRSRGRPGPRVRW